MTPAVVQLQKAKHAFKLLEYDKATQSTNIGVDSAQKLGIAEELVFKTLLACDESDPKYLVVAVIPVNSQLDLKALAKAAKIKKMRMADMTIAERTTGYVKGGISPFGQKKQLATFLDNSAERLPEIVVSAGKRGLSLKLAPVAMQELLHARLTKLTE